MNSISLIIGNIIALIASILMAVSGLFKKKNKIILVQTIQIGLSVISNIILGGITGAIINGISCIRNILCYKERLNKYVKFIIIILSIILSIKFNNLGVIGILPVISTVTYTLLIDIKDVIKFKWLVIFTMVMWFIYDFVIKSYTSSLFDLLNIITNVIALHNIERGINNGKIRKRNRKYKIKK